MSDYDEEDFENYDEDFEDDEEHEDVFDLPTKSASPAKTSDSPSTTTSRNQGISRDAGKGYGSQLNLYASSAILLTDAQRIQRNKNLLAALEKMKLVKLEVVRGDDMFTMTHRKLFELYDMRRSIYANMRVAACQTHEDAKDEEIQTDEVDAHAVACQVPDDRHAKNNKDVDGKTDQRTMQLTDLEAGIENRLSVFMSWAGPVMLAALGMAPSKRALVIPPAAYGMLSAGRITMGQCELLTGRPVVATAFCPGSLPWLLVAYGPVGAHLGADMLLKDHSVFAKGVLAVWDLSTPQAPHALLLCEGIPACCCWAPLSSTTLVFAGLEEGGICLWDLEEPDTGHPPEVINGKSYGVRRPSFSTESQAGMDGAAAAVVAICATPKADEASSFRSTPCHVVALNAWGLACVYGVAIAAPDRHMHSTTELGLRIGSRVRLVLTVASIRLGRTGDQGQSKSGKGAVQGTSLQTFSLQILPSICQVLVGAECGKVLRGSWVGTPPPPKEYQILGSVSAVEAQLSRGLLVPSRVTALAVSPFLPEAFLTGHDNGTIALHALKTATPMALWPEAARSAIRVLRWSPTRPTVFFALDSLATLHCFDLASSRAGPKHTEPFMAGGKKGSASAAFAVALSTSEFTGTDLPACFALGYDDGQVECHSINSQMSVPVANELLALQQLLPA